MHKTIPLSRTRAHFPAQSVARAERKPKPARRSGALGWRITGVALLVLVPVAAGILWASGWLPARLVPQKLIIRGCTMTTPEQILTKLECGQPVSYLALSQRMIDLDCSTERWLKGVRLHPLSLSSTMLTVHERRPLLRLVSAQKKYWLCDDGTLEQMDPVADQGGVFAAVRAMPSVELSQGVAQVEEGDVKQLFTAAACCQEAMPGMIARVQLDAQGQMHLYDKQGFRIFLGSGDALREKITVLPKALRVCNADMARLKYLDASNPRVFYQVWKEPLS